MRGSPFSCAANCADYQNTQRVLGDLNRMFPELPNGRLPQNIRNDILNVVRRLALT